MDVKAALVSVLFILLLTRSATAFILDGWGYRPPDPHCEQDQRYNGVMSAFVSDECISDTEAWPIVKTLFEQRYDCYQQFVKIAADYIDQHPEAGTHCTCIQDFHKVQDTLTSDQTIYWCHSYDNINCKYIVDYFFIRNQQNQISKCQTHHHVWKHLRDANDWGGLQIKHHLTEHLVKTYTSNNAALCQCSQVTPKPSTNAPTISTATPEPSNAIKTTSKITTNDPITTSTPKPSPQQTTTTKTTQTTTLAPQTTTSSTEQPTTKEQTAPNPSTTQRATSTVQQTVTDTPTCSKYEAVFDVAAGSSISNPAAFLCSAGTRVSSEAYVLTACNLLSPESWKPGQRILENCGSIRPYTPIASFSADTTGLTGYRENVGLAAIFLSCKDGGIQVAYQTCDSAPSIDIIYSNSTSPLYNADNFYVVI